MYQHSLVTKTPRLSHLILQAAITQCLVALRNLHLIINNDNNFHESVCDEKSLFSSSFAWHFSLLWMRASGDMEQIHCQRENK